jgi:Na+-translocating ferredoxin:NAD+ oxidoreductase subunit C
MRVAGPSLGASVGLRDHKELARDRPIENAPFPAVCTVAMQQGGGASAECVVDVGDIVAEGVLLGRSSGPTSANVHAPVPGRVTIVTDIRLPTGDWSAAVVIELEGRFARSGKLPRAYDWKAMPAATIVERVRSNGVVGLSGESFPLGTLLSAKGRRPESLVANGIDGEPYLAGSYRLLVERAAQVIAGLRIVEKILSPQRVIVAVEAERPEVAEVVAAAVRRAGLRYEVAALETPYPRGQMRHVLEEVTGRSLPYPRAPEDIGCVVAGVETLNAVYEAVVLDRPLFERVVTVSGIVRRPSNLKVRIGTPIRDIVEECGGLAEPVGTIVVGGPMTGFALDDLDVPMTKEVSGIVALPRQRGRGPRQTPCLSCGECVRVCPAGLHPALLHRQIEHRRFALSRTYGLLECSECGCCAYVCPAGIRLAESLRRGKAQLAAPQGAGQ